uniref:carbonic anhydrase n=1 Tax=viral metagenome TaxID=1070528 RepID=A0A6C0K0Z6_9ZZZZ
MSIYGSASSWGQQCGNSNQSPVNLSQSSSKPCDLLCDLVFDDAYISQANVVVSDEGLILQSQTSLGSCKYGGDSYTCNSLLVTHPSHHTVENIQADGEVVAIFSNPTHGMLCVSSLFRVNPTQTSSTHFFNAFIPYANPSASQSISLGEQWGLFMMVPPAGSYFVYDGSLVVPPCQSTKWVVFKSMINIDSNDFALLVRNVQAGSRPVQPVGDRSIYFNDTEQLPGGPMPHDGKTYMRCRRAGRKNDVRQIQPAGLKEKQPSKPNFIVQWATKQIQANSFLELVDVVLLFVSFGLGVYYAWKNSSDPRGFYIILLFQSFARWIRSFFFTTP